MSGAHISVFHIIHPVVEYKNMHESGLRLRCNAPDL